MERLDKGLAICGMDIITALNFQHNFITMLYRADVNSFKALKFVGYSEYQMTAYISTLLDKKMMQATMEDLVNVIKKMTMVARMDWLQKQQRAITNVIYPRFADG